MALAQAANYVEKLAGHDNSADTQQDVSSFSSGGEGDTMKALVWMGRNKVEIGTNLCLIEMKVQKAAQLT